ncbi:hypothetical protein COB64_01590 [Candidatus Wolfebacteria bacterium]|nr:MAG: hypothetical protein COB64_01590 [Candidatus Wolfebacteria bacterium]
MDPNDKKLLEVSIALSKENNKILKQMRSAEKRSRFFKVIKWLIIIGAALVGFLFIRPFLEQARSIFEQTVSGVTQLTEFSESVTDGSIINDILNKDE